MSRHPPSTRSARSSSSSSSSANVRAAGEAAADDAAESRRRPRRVIKLTLLGASSSGKSALRRRFVNGDFVPRYRATIGCDFVVRTVDVGPPTAGAHSDDDDNDDDDDDDERGRRVRTVDLQVWDTAGQERFKSISTPFFRASSGCILTFDYTRPVSDTIEQLGAWYVEFRQRCDSVRRGERFCWAVVGCKVDLVSSEHERDEIDRRVQLEVESWFELAFERERRGVDGHQDFVQKRLQVGQPTAIRGVTTTKKTTTNLNRTGTSNDQSRTERSTIEGGQAPRRETSPQPPPSSSSNDRPALALAHASSSGSIASVELSSSVPTPQALNPTSLLLMATSPPHAPRSVEPLGHPDAVVFEGGPFTAADGRILESTSHAGRGNDIERSSLSSSSSSSGADLGSMPASGDDDPNPRGGGGTTRPNPQLVERHEGTRRDGGHAGGEIVDRCDDTEQRGGQGGGEAARGMFKLFRTSAKTGLGVEQVFEYCARRALDNFEYNSRNHHGDGSLSPMDKTRQAGVIKINERVELSRAQKWKKACCT